MSELTKHATKICFGDGDALRVFEIRDAGSADVPSAMSAQREQLIKSFSCEIFACYARGADEDVRAPSID